MLEIAFTHQNPPTLEKLHTLTLFLLKTWITPTKLWFYILQDIIYIFQCICTVLYLYISIWTLKGGKNFFFFFSYAHRHARLKLPWQWLVGVVSCSFDGHRRRLPALTAHFLVQATHLLSQPTHPMFMPVLNYAFLFPVFRTYFVSTLKNMHNFLYCLISCWGDVGDGFGIPFMLNICICN